MVVRNFRHKGLEKFYTNNNPKGVPQAAAEKLRRMLTFLGNMADVSELHGIAVWKAHLLRADRKSTWSLFVTRNWRLTFRIEANEVRDLNLENYH